jgi:hypothetical protein
MHPQNILQSRLSIKGNFVQCAETSYRILKRLRINYKKISIIHFIIQAHKEIFGERLCSSDEPKV